MNNEILKVQGLKKKYGRVLVLDNVDITIKEGEFVAVMGASGSGKTTLLNCIATMEVFDEGSILLNGKAVKQLREKDLTDIRRNEMGYIFQDYNLLEMLTIRENIALPLTVYKYKEEKFEKIEEMARYFNIDNILERLPSEVSGGERQRCACARALIKNPRIILADEPTGALDRKSSQSLLRLLRKMNKDFKTSVLMVTHDLFSASYCDKVLYIQDGKILMEIERGNQDQGEYLQTILKNLYTEEEF